MDWRRVRNELPEPYDGVPYVDVLVWYRRKRRYIPYVATYFVERQEFNVDNVSHWSYIDVPDGHNKHRPLLGNLPPD